MTSPLQLPPNAWRNSKNYAADDFPVSTVPGDRIYHNVISGWWTWLESSPGVGWWTPAPSALLCKIYQSSTRSSVGTSAFTNIIGMDGVVKNVNSWWDTANSRFQPQVPGWYELGGSIAWQVTNVDGWRAACWRLNGSTLLSHGGNTVRVVTNTLDIPTVQLLPPQQVYLNGSTDYVEAMAISSADTYTYASGSPLLPENSWRSTNVWIKYMQFEA